MIAWMQEAIDSQVFLFTFGLREDCKMHKDIELPMTMISTINKDTIYFDQAIKQKDASQFIEAIISKMNDHIKWNTGS